MKIFDVDVSVRYIVFKMDGHEYTVQFRDNKRKGIHDIEISKDGKEQDVEIELTYPPLKAILKELRVVYFPNWFKYKIKKFKRKNN